MKGREETYVVAVAVLAALLVASSNIGQTGGMSFVGAYAYWLVRLLIEAGLFILARDTIERHFPAMRPGNAHGTWLGTGIAILISLVPFVLAITALDIVLGFPELGLEKPGAAEASKITEFGLELIYLFDNHLFLCLLLSIPRAVFRQHSGSSAIKTDAVEPSIANTGAVRGTSILEAMSPPLKGEVLWAEAQEHYVRLTTADETRMVLNRFSDVLRDLPDEAGVQVHRSHWVAYSAIAEVFKEGANLRLRLKTDDVVPVSRSYRSDTERRLSAML